VCGDPDVCRFSTVPWAYSPSAARAWVDRQREARAAGTKLTLAITRAGEDVALGNVNLVGFSDDGRQASLGYWLVPAARGHGLALGAARLLSGWGLERLGLTRIELAILPGNAPSRRLAERLGAAPEGIRQASHQAEGRAWDTAIYALHPPPGAGWERR
jgi:RimJ/RimL family protein N-acetyltransferase